MNESKRHMQVHLQAAQAWALRAASESRANPRVMREIYDRLCWAWLLADWRGIPTELVRAWIEDCASAVSDIAGDIDVSAREYPDLGSAHKEAQERVAETGFLTASQMYSDIGSRCMRYGLEPGEEQLSLLAGGGLKPCEPTISCGICAVREIADEVVGGVA